MGAAHHPRLGTTPRQVIRAAKAPRRDHAAVAGKGGQDGARADADGGSPAAAAMRERRAGRHAAWRADGATNQPAGDPAGTAADLGRPASPGPPPRTRRGGRGQAPGCGTRGGRARRLTRAARAGPSTALAGRGRAPTDCPGAARI